MLRSGACKAAKRASVEHPGGRGRVASFFSFCAQQFSSNVASVLYGHIHVHSVIERLTQLALQMRSHTFPLPIEKADNFLFDGLDKSELADTL